MNPTGSRKGCNACALTCGKTASHNSGVNIRQAHENWTELGSEDPMWVVLTDPSKKGNKWNREEFFATGQRDVKQTIEKLRGLGIALESGRALDFGCGVGRLSQALADYFDCVDGVDLSASMIEHAKTFNRRPEKVTYHLNVNEDLRAFASGAYDFVLSLISLQHTPPQFQENYVADFMRLLKPGGVAYFQTIHSRGWRSLVPHAAADAYRRVRSKGKAFIPMYGISVSRVRRAVQQGGGTIVSHDCHSYLGHESRYSSDHYTVKRDLSGRN